MNTVKSILCSFLIASASTLLGDTVPSLMNYQGRLSDSAGLPLVNGAYQLGFKIFTNQLPVTGEALLWAQSNPVTLAGGAFNVILGQGANLPGAATTDLGAAFGDMPGASSTGPDRFLEITVLRDPSDNTTPRTILPRQQLLSAPYSMVAARLVRDLQEALCPTGTVIAFAGPASHIPQGWLPCDGRTKSRTAHARLFSVIGTSCGAGDGSTTFHLPDYMGRFLRGVDYTSTIRDTDRNTRTAMASGGNAGRAVGSVQDDQFASHNHLLGYRAGTAPFGPYHGFTTGPSITPIEHETESVGGTETRPKNAYVNFIIKD